LHRRFHFSIRRERSLRQLNTGETTMKKLFSIALILASTIGAAHAADQALTARAIETAKRVPASLTTNIPGAGRSVVSNMPGPNATIDEVREVSNVPDDQARIVAIRKTFVVTALYDGLPFRVMDVVVDSEGVAYSTTQQSFKDPNGDELRIHVTSYDPIAVDVSVVKADAKVKASRERVAFGDLPVGADAFALREGRLAVQVERLEDNVDLRHESILVGANARFHKEG
jgi:hypothetical protein